MGPAVEHLKEARWQQVESLFLEAISRPVDERAASLTAACAGDAVLSAEVTGMLAAHEEVADDYLERLDAGRAAALLQETDGNLVESIGPYRLIEELGRGGMGKVYLAERADGQFEQQVALKLVKRGMDSDAVLRRFLAERQILARLQHPHIACLLDGGLHHDGRPYFAMERIEGRPITQYCDKNRLSVGERLTLFADVCRAVQYAHGNLVVHRDLKPSNILVTEQGQVKLLDFGIARVLDAASDVENHTLTEAGFRVITPEYAAPEQVRSGTITTATDVYALGVILYELLTGRRPYRLEGRGPDEVARIICDTEPERPSTAVGRIRATADSAASAISQARRTSLALLRRRLAGDLDTVVLKAMRKEPEQRYASTEAFVGDIKRYLDRLPVAARKGTWSYRAKRFVQRHGRGVAGATSFVLLLAAFVGVYMHGVAQESRAAQREAARAHLMAGVMQELLEAGDPYAWGAQRRDSLLLVLGREKVTTDLAGEPDLQVDLLTTLGRVYRRRGQYDEARVLLEQARAIARATYAAPHPSIITALKELGFYYSDTGGYEQAGLFHAEALTMQRQLFGDGHPEAIRGMNVLAQLEWLKGNHIEAERTLRQIVELGRETHGTTDPAYLSSLWKLARVRYIRGKFAEAEQHFLEILARRRERFGEPHRDVALAMQWLGLVLTDKGDFAASDAYLRQALAMQRDVLSDEHQDIAVSLFGLGLLAMEQGRYPEAVAWLEESIAMTRQVLGENHVDTALHMQILGEAYRLMGDYERSETMLRDALRRNRQVLDAPHKRLASILVPLGRTLSGAGELAAAKATLEEALEMFQRKGISRQRGRLDALVAYGEVLTRTGQPEEAEPLLREAVSVLAEKIVAPHNRYVIYARAALGNCLAAQHRYAEAEPILLKVFTTYRDHYGPNDPRTQTARKHLADLYAAWGKLVEAQSYRARPVAAR